MFTGIGTLALGISILGIGELVEPDVSRRTAFLQIASLNVLEDGYGNSTLARVCEPFVGNRFE